MKNLYRSDSCKIILYIYNKVTLYILKTNSKYKKYWYRCSE